MLKLFPRRIAGSAFGAERSRLTRFAAERRGNVLMIFAFAMIPMTFATAMGVDYAHAARLQTKLNAIADAAALAAVTKPMLNEDDSYARDVAQKMFMTQADVLNTQGLEAIDSLTIVFDHPNGTESRTAKVTYVARATNAFGGILGSPTITIGGSSTANNMVAPDIDFYVLLDTSPSMLLPATTQDLTNMTAATGGCSFACHQTNLIYNDQATMDKTKPSNKELICNFLKQNCKDYYTVAKENNIILRTDLLHDAVESITDLATQTASDNGAAYRIGLFKFDKEYGQIWPQSPIGSYNVDGNMSNVKNHVADAKTLTYCVNNYFTCAANDNDTATNFTKAFAGISSAMPATPGNGTRVNGDTPQATMFLITDGMRDESRPGGRPEGPIDIAKCKAIKDRGIRIAVLYTEYLAQAVYSPNPDDWSRKNVHDPYLSPTDKISPALSSCASPGLYYKVTTNDNISAALASLFQAAVATARLTK